MTTITAKEFKALSQKPKQNKYRNKPVEYNGIKFDSMKERDRYIFLKAREANGEIGNLELQPKLLLYSGTTPVKGDTGRHHYYKADFAYFDPDRNKRIIEDVKSKATITRLYKLKKAVLLACYPGIIIEEV